MRVEGGAEARSRGTNVEDSCLIWAVWGRRLGGPDRPTMPNDGFSSSQFVYEDRGSGGSQSLTAWRQGGKAQHPTWSG